jgi:three-Cys-motif partner protein
MTTPQETIWEIDPHTLAKHDILRRYLGAWFPILGTYNQRIVYIDGFCGPGRYKGGQDGSPVIALKEALKHSQRLSKTRLTFLFTDERPDRIDHLRNELSQIKTPSSFTIQPETGEFDKVLTSLLDGLDANGAKLAPTFAFIDPFGFKGLSFELVKKLLTNDKTEVFVNVMADSINRFLEHPEEQIPQHIVSLFGTPDVLEVAKQFGDRVGNLRALYQAQLRKCARFVRFFEMRDSHGRVIYYLFFAGNHPLGHIKMKEAFWRVDPSSGFSFSDATNPDQLVLFEIDETPKLAELLTHEFAGRKVAVEKIQTYVENETAFISSHMRAALKQLESADRISVEPIKTDGKKRKAGSYPQNVLINFRQLPN